MANRTFYPSMSYGVGRVYLEFGFIANGTGVPATSTIYGANAVASFSHTAATAIIGVTLLDSFRKLVYASADSLESDGTNTTKAAGDWCTVSMPTNNEATAKGIQFNIKSWAAGGGAQNDQTGRMHVCMAFQNTTFGGAGA